MTDKLLPCPFCGGTAEIKAPYRNVVICTGCLARGPVGKEADDAWNRRAALQSAADTPAPKVEPVAWATIPKVSGGLRWTTDIKAQAERWEADGHALAPLYEHPPQPKAALQRALDFMEWISVEPVLDINDQELTLSDVSRYAAIELDSIRKSLPPSKVREE